MFLEDKNGTWSLPEVIQKDHNRDFKLNDRLYPRNTNHKSVYWYKVRLELTESLVQKQSLIEFFDQTTGHITAFLPDANGRYKAVKAGAADNFAHRLYHHKNFEFLIPNQSKGRYTYYFHLKSANLINVIIVYRTIVDIPARLTIYSVHIRPMSCVDES